MHSHLKADCSWHLTTQSSLLELLVPTEYHRRALTPADLALLSVSGIYRLSSTHRANLLYGRKSSTCWQNKWAWCSQLIHSWFQKKVHISWETTWFLRRLSSLTCILSFASTWIVLANSMIVGDFGRALFSGCRARSVWRRVVLQLFPPEHWFGSESRAITADDIWKYRLLFSSFFSHLIPPAVCSWFNRSTLSFPGFLSSALCIARTSGPIEVGDCYRFLPCYSKISSLNHGRNQNFFREQARFFEDRSILIPLLGKIEAGTGMLSRDCNGRIGRACKI
jgi:hypothetical protein